MNHEIFHYIDNLGIICHANEASVAVALNRLNIKHNDCLVVQFYVPRDSSLT